MVRLRDAVPAAGHLLRCAPLIGGHAVHAAQAPSDWASTTTSIVAALILHIDRREGLIDLALALASPWLALVLCARNLAASLLALLLSGARLVGISFDGVNACTLEITALHGFAASVFAGLTEAQFVVVDPREPVADALVLEALHTGARDMQVRKQPGIYSAGHGSLDGCLREKCCSLALAIGVAVLDEDLDGEVCPAAQEALLLLLLLLPLLLVLRLELPEVGKILFGDPIHGHFLGLCDLLRVKASVPSFS
mmetsp:Transcript_69744/g.145755  ORF Transcript_69744/g.145755 Transcript_69744/m.145755 type:complete len:253 (+) Transcript_69744:469-1227(+)